MEYYGGWPTFHDADYVAIHIDMDGPTISISLRLYDWDEAAQKASRPSITLKWSGVQGLDLVGIEELGQNAVGRMKIIEDRGGILTIIESTDNGTSARFRAHLRESDAF